MDKYLKELDEKIEQLKKTREELVKQGLGAAITAGITGSGSTPQGGINSAVSGMFGKKEDDEEDEEKKDEKKDKKQIEEKLDEHNEKKHGEAKDEDSAFKTEVIKLEKSIEVINFNNNDQWSLD